MTKKKEVNEKQFDFVSAFEKALQEFSRSIGKVVKPPRKKIQRVWAMPSRWTFTIKPIKKMVEKYVGSGKGWIDPFAGKYSPAEITNDIDPQMPTKFHLHAKEFAKMLDGKYEGVLFDPPYSLRQVKECYNKLGIDSLTQEESNNFPNDIKDIIAPKIKGGGYAISFGWNSSGFGIQHGFKIIEILLVCHGGKHNDTIVTVEQKMQEVLDD